MADFQLSVPTESRLAHRTCHTGSSRDTLSTAVATALATAKDTDSTATPWTLTDYVDPDALDALFVEYHDEVDGYTRFEFVADDHRVVVESDGTISVYEFDDDQTTSQ